MRGAAILAALVGLASTAPVPPETNDASPPRSFRRAPAASAPPRCSAWARPLGALASRSPLLSCSPRLPLSPPGPSDAQRAQDIAVLGVPLVISRVDALEDDGWPIDGQP